MIHIIQSGGVKMKTVILLKSYVKGHTRRLKNGKTVDVKAHYDKRTRKGAEHAPTHKHNLAHMSPEQRSRFDAIHREHHLLTFYHRHALTKRIAEHEKAISDLDEKAKAETNSVKKTKLHNKAMTHKTALIRHKKNLAHIDDAISYLAGEKEKHVQGAGTLDMAEADKHHAAYVEKLGSPWVDTKAKIAYTEPEASHSGEANNQPQGEGDKMNAQVGDFGIDKELQTKIDKFVANRVSAAVLEPEAEKNDDAYQRYDAHNDAAAAILKTLKKELASHVKQEDLFHLWQAAYTQVGEMTKQHVATSNPDKARAMALTDLYDQAHKLAGDMKIIAGYPKG